VCEGGEEALLVFRALGGFPALAPITRWNVRDGGRRRE
jgi:hypothetical protein